MIRDDTPPSRKAVREALVNCLANADFNAPMPVVVGLLPQRQKLVIENSGGIRAGLDQMLRGGVSDQRNPSILNMFCLIKHGERYGGGVPSIMQAWSSMGMKAPEYAELFRPPRTMLTLSLEDEGSGTASVVQEAGPGARCQVQMQPDGGDRRILHSPSDSGSEDRRIHPAPSDSEVQDRRMLSSPSDSGAEDRRILSAPSDPAVEDRRKADVPSDTYGEQNCGVPSSKARILKFIQDRSPCSRREIERAAGLRQSWTRELLRKLESEGRIVPSGMARARVYRMA